MRKIKHPLTGKMTPITTVLKDLAGQENCDGEPYDQMMEAAHYIDKLLELVTSYENLTANSKELVSSMKQLINNLERQIKK